MQRSGLKSNTLYNVEGKGAHKTKAQNGQSLSWFQFISTKHLGVLLLPSGWDASLSQSYPLAVCHWYPFKHLGDERQSGVKFPV